MVNLLKLQGTVTAEPEVEENHTVFVLQVVSDDYRIVRYDPGWQIKDVIFLRVGQIVEVMGEVTQSNHIVAHKVTIINNLDTERKENDDTEAI